MRDAIEKPNNYVLKPQKEGGGNNFFDDEIPPLLRKMLDKPEEAGELLTYLIMERIVPPVIKFTSLRSGEIAVNDGLSELGIFSCVFT
jgi:glutathione synthase